MENIKVLSAQELSSAFSHQFQDVNFWDPQFECAVCGEDPEARFYYICDDCEKSDE